MATILIGADICPIELNEPLLRAGDPVPLFNDLLEDFREADLVVANLECPLVERPSAILKTGPTFGESPDCINGIKNARINVLSLANNHILDHGPAGLRSTLRTCANAGIDTVGAGEDLAQARRILIKKAGDLRIGFLAMAEHEFSIATESSAGANPLDVIDFVRNVRQHRSEFDYLVVLLHGAHEFQPITPRIQKTCRFLIEMGANAVIVQHPHTLGGYEDYCGGHIVYGQGALLMDEAIYRDSKSFHEGFLVKLTISSQTKSDSFTPVPLQQGSAPPLRDSLSRSGGDQLSIIPFTQSDPEPGARRMQGTQGAQFLKDLQERSRKIQDPALVEAEWHAFCRKHKHSYLASLLGFNRVIRKLNVNGIVPKLLYGKRPLLGVRNLVQCETHREAIQTIFEADAKDQF
jgi:poly-gamma-glutamate capsule biosynthesis protein CapA/YwtB (metallophosphatase superfamily)